jgi:hypothetical protein
MPLKDAVMGTEADGAKNDHYCAYCYADGAFTAPDATVEEMRAYSIKGMTENGWPKFLATFMTKNQSKLPRWQKSDTSIP